MHYIDLVVVDTHTNRSSSKHLNTGITNPIDNYWLLLNLIVNNRFPFLSLYTANNFIISIVVGYIHERNTGRTIF